MNWRLSRSLAALATCLALTAESRALDGASKNRWDSEALARLESPPLGLPPLRVPDSNPATIAKIALGRKLFFDRRLSVNNTMSCAMCHIPEQGFTSHELATPIGVAGRSLKRNAPTILNSAYMKRLFLDGRAESLEEQATVPLLAHSEMANRSSDALLDRLQRLTDYDGLFEDAFDSAPSMELIGKAIASWERTLLAADSPFDRWRYGGQANALTQQEREGFEVFMGKARCAKCHLVREEYALFTDESFHDTGIGYREVIAHRSMSPVRVEVAPQHVVLIEQKTIRQLGQSRMEDLGRFEITQDPADKWRFRTPTLRNVAMTGPYMHDGSLRTLEAVVEFYNRGAAPHPGLDPLIRPLGLSDTEVAAVVAFLRSLTASNLGELTADARSENVGN